MFALLMLTIVLLPPGCGRVSLHQVWVLLATVCGYWGGEQVGGMSDQNAGG